MLISFIGIGRIIDNKMNIDILTLVIAAMALIVGFATLVVAIMTYRYYIKSDRRNVRRKLRQKEKQLDGLKNFTRGSAFAGWGRQVSHKHFQKIGQLEKEVEDLRDRL